MAELTIGEVAARSGVAASAIRYYEVAGLITPPPRRNGRRMFAGAVFDELGLVELAKSAGFTVAEIRRLRAGFSRSTPPGKRWRAFTRAKLAEIDARIAEAERMKGVLRTVMRCRCPTLADCGRARRG